MPSKPNQQYALVKWLSGENEGTYTHNVPMEWIRDFDPVKDVCFEESYIVEWRRPPMPRAGWDVYDCEVLEVSGECTSLSYSYFSSVFLYVTWNPKM